MILEQLTSSTAAAHASLERRLRIALPAPSLEDYRIYLAAMYGFLAPLEARWRRGGLDLPTELELDKRYKAELLRADLALLDSRIGTASTPLCASLPANDHAAGTLGTLYVLEGSTLGARWLLRHLAPLGIEPANGYLRSYDDALGPMWEKMRATLRSYHDQNPHQAGAILDSASRTFLLLDDWLVSCGAAKASGVA